MAPRTPEGWPRTPGAAWAGGLALAEVSPGGVVLLEGEGLSEGS